jgi:hypothetical protein
MNLTIVKNKKNPIASRAPNNHKTAQRDLKNQRMEVAEIFRIKTLP